MHRSFNNSERTNMVNWQMKKISRTLISVTTIFVALATLTTNAASQSKAEPKDSVDISEKGSEEAEFHGRVIKLDRIKIARGLGSLRIDINLPRGYHFIDKAPSRLAWRTDNGKVITFVDSTSDGSQKKVEFPFRLPIEAFKGKTELILDAFVILCSNDNGICLFDEIRIHLPIKITKDGSHKLSIEIDAEAPELGR